jgi:HK97 family phage major capsid protein/HK97 family phage prohead protease
MTTAKTLFVPIQKAVSGGYDATFVVSAASADRVQDTINPKAYARNVGKRLIALFQHDHKAPMGYWENFRQKGGEFVGDFKAASTELGKMVKQLIADDVPLMASIGFSGKGKPNEKGGMDFDEVDIYEVSIVSVGAHPKAIMIAKSYGYELSANDGETFSIVKSLATSGNNDGTRKTPARDLGKTVSINSPQKATEMKTLADQIKGFEARKTELANTVKSILDKAADESRTLDVAEAEAHDTALEEIKQVELHIGRLKSAEAMQISTATPVAGDTQKAATQSRTSIITMKDNLPKGVEFARFAKCLALAQGNLMQAKEIAVNQYPDASRLHTVIKAAVASGSTNDPTWGGALVEHRDFVDDFIEFLRPRTIIGQFGTGNIPSLRNVPFNVHIKGQSTGTGHFWTGEGLPIGVTKADFNEVYLRWAKVNSIVAMSNELIRVSSPSADILIRDDMVRELSSGMDQAFINKANAGVANVRPASVTNGIVAVPATGTDYDAFIADVKAMHAPIDAANVDDSTGVYIMGTALARALAGMQNALGNKQFPGLTKMGGDIDGYPVIVSNHVPAGDLVFLVADQIYISDDGAVSLKVSQDATLEMDNAPTGTATRSMFQHDETAMLASRWVNWQRRRNSAVGIITGAAYA